MVRQSLVAVLVAGVTLASCRETDPVILSLEGQEVRRSDFQQYLNALEEPGLGPLTPEARQGLLDTFLEEQVLLLEARRRGLVGPEAGAEEEQQAVLRLVAEAVPPPTIPEARVRAYYDAHAEEFHVPETVTVRQILVGTLNEARDVKRRLWRAPREFETLAGSRSIGPEASAGGLMGTFERGQLPEKLEEAAFSLKPGQTSSPIQTSLGYHVLRLDSRQPARELSFEEASGWIRERLSREKADAGVRALVAGLLSRARVNHEAALRTPPSS
jgi:peptidyl-prolyl cis-trans isomerase C